MICMLSQQDVDPFNAAANVGINNCPIRSPCHQQWVYGAAKWRKQMIPVFTYSMNLVVMAYGALHSDHTFKLGLMAQRCL